MNEAETRAEHIDPALKAAGSGVVERSRILREYPPSTARSDEIRIQTASAHFRVRWWRYLKSSTR